MECWRGGFVPAQRARPPTGPFTVMCDESAVPHHGRSAVAPLRQTLAGAPLAAVGVGGAAVAVRVLVAPLVRICLIVKRH